LKTIPTDAVEYVAGEAADGDLPYRSGC